MTKKGHEGMTNKKNPLAAVLGTCVLLAACSDGNTPAPAQTAMATSKPAPAAAKGWDCSALLGVQEIERIVGRAGARLVSSVRGDTNADEPGHTKCGYELPPAGGMHFFFSTGPALDPDSGRGKVIAQQVLATVVSKL